MDWITIKNKFRVMPKNNTNKIVRFKFLLDEWTHILEIPVVDGCVPDQSINTKYISVYKYNTPSINVYG